MPNFKLQTLLGGTTIGLPLVRLFSTTRFCPKPDNEGSIRLTHVSEKGSAHMVSITDKSSTKRLAKAVCTVHFTNSTAIRLIKDSHIKKGDVLGVARVAGIMAAKKTSELIPLCHSIAISSVSVELEPAIDEKRIDISAVVMCEGKTGVEMEALTAASTAALTVYDMCKAVDKNIVIDGLRVILKEGGKSGRWIEGKQSLRAVE